MNPFCVKLNSPTWGIDGFELVLSDTAANAGTAALARRDSSYSVEFAFPLVTAPLPN